MVFRAQSLLMATLEEEKENVRQVNKRTMYRVNHLVGNIHLLTFFLSHLLVPMYLGSHTGIMAIAPDLMVNPLRIDV